MRLKKTDREKLYKAKGKSSTITWPEDAPFPRKGKRYAVYNEDGDRMFSVRVEGAQKLAYETRATVKIDDDPFLPMIGINGVRRDDGGYETEPERVDRGYEKILCNENLYKSGLVRDESRRRAKSQEASKKASKGRLAQEYAIREQKRLEAA